MPSEIYLQSDPPRMYQVMRQTRKTCFAFTILAAGRIGDGGVEDAFTLAFAGIKATDGVFVGMFPRVKDEVRENAERVCRILRSAWAASGWPARSGNCRADRCSPPRTDAEVGPRR